MLRDSFSGSILRRLAAVAVCLLGTTTTFVGTVRAAEAGEPFDYSATALAEFKRAVLPDLTAAQALQHVAAARRLGTAGTILFSCDALVAPPNRTGSLSQLGRAAFATGSH